MLYDEGTFGRKLLRADSFSESKKKKRKSKRWQATDKEFRCSHCKQMVFLTSDMGTGHRNHCPYCLYSLHVDTRPGNRASDCRARMMPVGLTIKHNGLDRYGNKRSGDIMLVHLCTACDCVNINRIAADDTCREILDLFDRSLSLPKRQRALIEKAGVMLLQASDRDALQIGLFGKSALS